GGEAGDYQAEHEAEADALEGGKDGHGREDQHGHAHAVENVDAQQLGRRAGGKAEDVELDAEEKRDQKQIAGAFERGDDALPGFFALPLLAVHEKGESNAGEQEKNGGRHAAEELRENEG